jgi:hypothetical protein
MAGSERSEATSGVVRSVLEEDVMLGFGADVWHECAESKPTRRSVAERAGQRDGAKRILPAQAGLTGERIAAESNREHV